MSGRSAWLRDNITKYFSFSAIIILLVALSLTQDNFLGTSNLKTCCATRPLMIMSAGMTMVLLFGSIDLSMGAVCSVSNVTYIHLMLAFQDSFSNPLLTSLAAMAVSLAFGLASGLALGIIHVKLKVPSFIASPGLYVPMAVGGPPSSRRTPSRCPKPCGAPWSGTRSPSVWWACP